MKITMGNNFLIGSINSTLFFTAFSSVACALVP